MEKKVSRTPDLSFSRGENLAVLHAIEGQTQTEPGSEPEGAVTRVHMSLAFVHGVKMPYFPYEALKIQQRSLQKIQEFGHWIALDALEVQRRRARLAEPKTMSADPRANYLAARHDKKHKSLSGLEGELSIIDQIRERGKEIVELLEFETMFEMLHDLRDVIHQLHIVTNIGNVPWDWMYHRGEFLSDLFGIGLSARDKRFEDAKEEIKIDVERFRNPGSSVNKCVLHYYCRYLKGSMKSFPGMDDLNKKLQQLLKQEFGRNIIGIEVTDVSDITETIDKYKDHVELVIFSGHFEEEGFVFQGRFTKRHFGSAQVPARLTLKRRPIVIFGGCASENSGLGVLQTSTLSPYVRKRVLNLKSLPDRFFDAGASACVVTSAEVQYSLYEKILPLLVSQLATDKSVSIGRAVRTMRKSIGSNEALLMALYQLHVLGDPTATIW